MIASGKLSGDSRESLRNIGADDKPPIVVLLFRPNDDKLSQLRFELQAQFWESIEFLD